LIKLGAFSGQENGLVFNVKLFEGGFMAYLTWDGKMDETFLKNVGKETVYVKD